MSLRISALTREFIRYPVSARRDGVDIDVTVDPVEFALTPHRVAPATSDWNVGAWETDGSITLARILVGPSAVPLTAGRYDVWIRISDNPEVPVRRIDTIHVF